MSKFNLLKIKKQAQAVVPDSPASEGGYGAGAAMNAGQSLTSGTSVVDVMNDANLANSAINRKLTLTNPSAPLVFLGPDKSGSGMAIVGIPPSALIVASGKNNMKKKSQMAVSDDNSQHIDSIANSLVAMGLRDEQIDKIMFNIKEEVKKDGWGILNQVDNSDLGSGPAENTFKQEESLISAAINKISKLKNINASNLEAFEGDNNNMIVAELDSDRVFKVAKSALDKKFDRCVEDVKEKGGKSAKNPYAVCMVSTGKGKKQEEKKASNNPFVKNSKLIKKI